MPKHTDNVPKIADFKAPWESEHGEVEIDKDKLKKYIHNLHLDKAKAQDARDAEAEKVATLTSERDELKEQVDSKDPDSGKKITKLEQERDEAKAATAKAEQRADRAEVAHEKGLTPKQAKRLSGETKEELEADADELLEDLGIKPGKPGEDDDDDDEDETDEGRTQPRSGVRSLVTPGDTGQPGSSEPDYVKAAAQIMGSPAL